MSIQHHSIAPSSAQNVASRSLRSSIQNTASPATPSSSQNPASSVARSSAQNNIASANQHRKAIHAMSTPSVKSHRSPSQTLREDDGLMSPLPSCASHTAIHPEFLKLSKKLHGKAVQELLLCAAAQGKDTMALLNNPSFTSLQSIDQMRYAATLLASSHFDPTQFAQSQWVLAAMYQALTSYKDLSTTSAPHKNAAVVRIANLLRAHPYLFQLVDHCTKWMLAIALLEQLGHIEQIDYIDTVKAALAAIRCDQPQLYKAIFGKAAEAMQQDGFALKHLLQSIHLPKTEESILVALESAYNVILQKSFLDGRCSLHSKQDVIDRTQSPKHGHKTSVTVISLLAMSELALAITTATTTVPSFLVSVVTGALVSLWQWFCEHQIATQIRENIAACLNDPAIAP